MSSKRAVEGTTARQEAQSLPGPVAVLMAALVGLLWLSIPSAWILLVYAPGGPMVSPWPLFAGLTIFSLLVARLALVLLDRR